MKKLLSCLLALVLVICLAPSGGAVQEDMADLCPDLSEYISHPGRRTFVQQTVGYHLRHDEVVRDNLKAGYCAVFFFEGCSDNMDHPEYQDVSYYRISAVCLVLKLDDKGIPQVRYFNENCSTLPDRPADYGPRKEEVPADVGPATVRDGTYEVFSVRHGGAYEALHIQSSYLDDTVPAIYMTPHGFTKVQATQINIHTRNVNHILKHDMWSEGCILVGGGEFEEFSQLMAASYYGIYDFFVLDIRVGSVTINRQYLKEQMYQLYDDYDAVDFLLSSSRPMLPKKYLERCGEVTDTAFEGTLWALPEATVMSLPCSNSTDARAIPLGVLPEGEEWIIEKAITNTRGTQWYVLNYKGQTGYVYSGHFKEPTTVERLWRTLFG